MVAKWRDFYLFIRLFIYILFVIFVNLRDGLDLSEPE